MSPLLLIVIVIILLALGGGVWAHPRYGPAAGWSPLGIIVVLLVVLWLFGLLPPLPR